MITEIFDRLLDEIELLSFGSTPSQLEANVADEDEVMSIESIYILNLN